MAAYEQLELPDRTWIHIGDRVMMLAGCPTQECGTVVEFRHMSGRDGLFPVVLWDAGYVSFASYEWGLRKLENTEQLSLF